MKWLTAVQAQDFAGAKWSLGLRMKRANDALVEKAFNDGEILRTHVLRPTWHFVLPEDIGWLLDLTAPRVHALNATYYRRLGIDDRERKRTEKALVSSLEGRNYRTRDELREAFQRAGIAIDGDQRVAYLLMRAELDGIIASGPRRGRQFTYALLSERAPAARRISREEAAARLARRFFVSRGPATVQDFAKWSGLTVAMGNAAVHAARESLHNETIDSRSYWSSPSAARSLPNKPTAQLMSIYDEYVSSYRDRSAMADRDLGKRLLAFGNALLYIVVVNGKIAGTFRRRVRGKTVEVDMNLFRSFSAAERHALDDAVDRYTSFFGGRE